MGHVGPPKVEELIRKLLDQRGKQPSLAERAKCVGFIGALLPDLAGYSVADPRFQETLRLVMDIFDACGSKIVPLRGSAGSG